VEAGQGLPAAGSREGEKIWQVETVLELQKIKAAQPFDWAALPVHRVGKGHKRLDVNAP